MFNTCPICNNTGKCFSRFTCEKTYCHCSAGVALKIKDIERENIERKNIERENMITNDIKKQIKEAVKEIKEEQKYLDSLNDMSKEDLISIIKENVENGNIKPTDKTNIEKLVAPLKKDDTKEIINSLISLL